MFVRRVHRRRSGPNATTVLLTLSALGLLYLILRPGDDNAGKQHRQAVAAVSATDGEDISPSEPQEVSGLRQQVERESGELTRLRSAAEQMRAQLGELRKQREAVLSGQQGGQPGAAPNTGASSPAPGPMARTATTSPDNQPGGEVISAGAGNPKATPNAADAPNPSGGHAAPQMNAVTTPAAPPGQAATPPSAAQTAATGAAQPAGGQTAAAAATAEHPRITVHRPHNARGYMLLAREQLQAGSSADAADALEHAETWALNSTEAYRSGVDPTDNPLIDTIQQARARLRAGHPDGALRLLNSVLPKQKRPRTVAANKQPAR